MSLRLVGGPHFEQQGLRVIQRLILTPCDLWRKRDQTAERECNLPSIAMPLLYDFFHLNPGLQLLHPALSPRISWLLHRCWWHLFSLGTQNPIFTPSFVLAQGFTLTGFAFTQNLQWLFCNPKIKFACRSGAHTSATYDPPLASLPNFPVFKWVLSALALSTPTCSLHIPCSGLQWWHGLRC